MDLAQIGAHCSLPSCNVLDFLPLTCKCSNIFCSQHIIPDRHDCPVLNAKFTHGLPTFDDQLPRCALDGCKKLSLRSANSSADETCTTCKKSFCVDHRHPETHQCPSITVQEPISKKGDKIATASGYIPKKAKLTRNKPPTDPVKLAQWREMEVMTMRHRASPGDPKDKTVSLPPDQRLHVKVVVEDVEHIFWFRKTIVTGRALDLLVQQLKLSFPGNPPLKLCIISPHEEESVCLLNDQLLADQVEETFTLIVSPAS